HHRCAVQRQLEELERKLEQPGGDDRRWRLQNGAGDVERRDYHYAGVSSPHPALPATLSRRETALSLRDLHHNLRRRNRDDAAERSALLEALHEIHRLFASDAVNCE